MKNPGVVIPEAMKAIQALITATRQGDVPETTLGGEAARERAVWFDVDDRALLSSLLEDGGQELAPLSSRAGGVSKGIRRRLGGTCAA
jgi:hypothetical protein